MSHGPFMETRSGRRVAYLDPQTSDIDLRDIAHSLAMIVRFNGHTSVRYSVAEHSMLCASLAAKNKDTPRMMLLMLMHDAHEAYVGDVSQRLKLILVQVERLERQIQEVIYDAFGIRKPSDKESRDMKRYDNVALTIEARQLMKSKGSGWDQELEDDVPEIRGLGDRSEDIARLTKDFENLAKTLITREKTDNSKLE